MLYAEAAYFDGAHVQHIADYYEEQRIKRLRNNARKAAEQFERRRVSRARFGVDTEPKPGLRLVHG
ncbi:hypothetical protein [Sphingomonas phage Kimi]|nr:hypothetical protein [Sphingomonas phage Kimi]